MQYNPLSTDFLTVQNAISKNGQDFIRIILHIPSNVFYTLDDDGNFRPINQEIGNAYLSYYMTGNTLATTIPTINTWQTIASNAPIVQKYSNTVNDALTVNTGTGVVTYNSSTIPQRWVKIEGTITLSDGNNNDIHIALFKNNQLQAETITKVVTQSGNKQTTLKTLAVINMSNGDTFTLKVLNSTSTSAVTVHTFNVFVTGL
jgi:hypothetical protein